MNSVRKKIKINFTDFWSAFNINDNFILDILSKYYDVEISNNPDFVFCSCFGYDFLKFKCPRILFIFENITPDFSLYDYIVGFDWIEYEDRYLRFPLYAVSNYRRMLIKASSKHRENRISLPNKFCNFVVSNADNSQNCREKFYELLSKYKSVDSGGRFLNNVGGPVQNKFEFQQNYKFSITFENSEAIGYTTEKIIEAWAAGTIPIYWGNPEIQREFNTKAMINCYEFSNFEEVCERVREIDSNDELFKKIVSEPIFTEETCGSRYLSLDLLENYFKNILDQDPQKAYRRVFRRKGFDHSEEALRFYYSFKIKPKMVFRKLIPSSLKNKIKEITRTGKM